tara:strand:- start:410484 stop:410756 length:273 start_codon:yes stop_codon:yes gene_type:complete
MSSTTNIKTSGGFESAAAAIVKAPQQTTVLTQQTTRFRIAIANIRLFSFAIPNPTESELLQILPDDDVAIIDMLSNMIGILTTAKKRFWA